MVAMRKATSVCISGGSADVTADCSYSRWARIRATVWMLALDKIEQVVGVDLFQKSNGVPCSIP